MFVKIVFMMNETVVSFKSGSQKIINIINLILLLSFK